MSYKLKILLLILAVGIPTLVLGPILFPPAQPVPYPTLAQLLYYVLLLGIEALVLGGGVALAVFGWPKINSVQILNAHLLKAQFISLVWLLIAWWFHDILHIYSGSNLTLHLLVDYIFHLGGILATLTILFVFLKQLNYVLASQQNLTQEDGEPIDQEKTVVESEPEPEINVVTY